jgi:hypothetical protein
MLLQGGPERGEPAAAEGKLACPGCAAKLGRFCLEGAVQCACRAAHLAPAFCIQRARVDAQDLGQDLGAAVAAVQQQWVARVAGTPPLIPVPPPVGPAAALRASACPQPTPCCLPCAALRAGAGRVA